MREELVRTLCSICDMMPEAYALVYGSEEYFTIQGTVLFFPIWGGTLVVAEVTGLPEGDNRCDGHFFGFHIHEGSECTGTKEDPFANTGGHFNPYNCQHPSNAGDMPPLLSDTGYALNIFYTDRFMPEEVVGHTVVVHDMPDDFKTQPSGASGMKIACGEIKSNAI